MIVYLFICLLVGQTHAEDEPETGQSDGGNRSKGIGKRSKVHYEVQINRDNIT